MQTFTRDDLPEGFRTYRRKITETKAVRIDGPFVVHTQEGPIECLDGWLAIDSEGHPYPIKVSVFSDTFHQTPIEDEA